MSYKQDSVYRTVQWLRAKNGSETFARAFASVWGRWAHVEPRRVRVRLGLINYKPFQRARVMAEVSLIPGRLGSSAVTLNLFLHVHADERHARDEYEAGTRRDLVCCYGPPVFQLEDRNLVGWTLPNAPNMAELRTLLDPASFKALLSRLRMPTDIAPMERGATLVRYVPLKRAILTWTDPHRDERLYLKLIEGSQAAAAALNLLQVHAHAANGELPFAVPRPVHYSPDLNTMVMSEVPGDGFTTLMARGDGEAFAQVGRALAKLHCLPAAPPTIWSAEGELSNLKRHVQGASRALPGIAGRLDAIMRRLERLPAVPVTAFRPIHGNLFGDQILYDRGATVHRVGIVDWDSWSLGDPHFDLGRLIAHFLYLARTEQLSGETVTGCIEALLRSYATDAECTIDRRALDWHVAAALLLRAKISSLRKLRPGWPEHFDLMVAEAERILDGNAAAAPWQRARRVETTRQVELATL